MDAQLWDSIRNFNFDDTPGDYSFSIRLASENYWTENFTRKAILEYKKFMYLAAISDQMVSPSEVVDTVWHQHLVFTQSYNDFCRILGKQVQHVPSTHNKADFSKFMQAKERTKKLYHEHFGDQPEDIWEFSGMYESLEWPKAKINLRTFLLFGILGFFLLMIPFYFVLRPIYVHIPNPAFPLGYIALVIGTFLCLRVYNGKRLAAMIRRVKRSSFINDLSPSEAIYLQRQSTGHVVHHTIHQLIQKKKLHVNDDKTLQFQLRAEETLDGFTSDKRWAYVELYHTIKSKPVIRNVKEAMDAFRKYALKSVVFGKLFYFNFALLAFVLMLGCQRLVIGVLRDKPIGYIVIILIVFFVLIIDHLRKLTNTIITKTVPALYKERTEKGEYRHDPSWQYFVFGTIILMPEIRPMAASIERPETPGRDSDSGSSSSCGSSCGSSCSSCGGCGGGD